MGRPTSAELKAKIEALESEITSYIHEKNVRTEAQLIEQQSRYKRLFKYAPMGILLMDAEARFADANQKALEILGSFFNIINWLLRNGFRVMLTCIHSIFFQKLCKHISFFTKHKK